jgi:hypothetical protein
MPRLRLSGINTLNTELSPICHLLALLGAHHILHVSRIRVKPLLSYSLCLYGMDRAKFTFFNFILGLFNEAASIRDVNMTVSKGQ